MVVVLLQLPGVRSYRGVDAASVVFQVWIKHINGFYHADGQLRLLQRYVPALCPHIRLGYSQSHSA